MSLKAFALLLLGIVCCYCVATFAQATMAARFTATTENVSGAGEAIKINLTSWSTDAQRDEFVAAWTLTNAAPATESARGGRGGARGGGRGGRGGRGARGAAAADADGATPAATPANDLPPDPDAVDANDPAFRFGRGGARGRVDAAPQMPEASLAAALKKAPTIGILWTSETIGYSIKYAYRMPLPGGGERIILATDRRVGAWSTLWKPAATSQTSEYPFSIIELHLNSKGEGEGRGVVGGKIVVDNDAKTLALDGYNALPIILKNIKRANQN